MSDEIYLPYSEIERLAYSIKTLQNDLNRLNTYADPHTYHQHSKLRQILTDAINRNKIALIEAMEKYYDQ